MKTEESCTRVVGTSCMQSCWKKPGRRKWTNGAKDPRPNCPSGSASGRARSPVTRSPPTTRMRDLPKLHLARRRKRKKSKSEGTKENVKYFPTFPTNKLTNQPINCQSGARRGGGSTRHGGGASRHAQLDWRIFHPVT